MRLTRREYLTCALAAGALTGLGPSLRAQTTRQAIRQEDLLRFNAKGQVTILHMADCHAQLMPCYFREPSVNVGVGAARALPPHVTGAEFLSHFGIKPGSWRGYALSSSDFQALAHTYGKVGGMDRLATLVRAIREERGPERTLLLDGGDALQGSYTALKSAGGDMVRVLDQLGVEATTGHWEFTLGAARVSELFGDRTRPGTMKAQFLAGNVLEDEWREPAFKGLKLFEKGGVPIAVIGQAFPFCAVANPRWMMDRWSFALHEVELRRNVEAARRVGAQLVILLSHNGFDVDRKLATRVEGIDVILTAHTHDALPEPVKVGDTLLIASGSSAKFLSRLDLEVRGGRLVDYSYALIPVLADAITPDPQMARLIAEIRAPHAGMLAEPLAETETLLYRRGNVNGTFDDVICAALLEERDAEIALSPGFRWGPTLLAGEQITWDDLYSATAISYPACYRLTMSGAAIRGLLEDVADNLFNPDPYYQQGGDMVRVGGISFAIDIEAKIGMRIKDLRLTRTGVPMEAARDYVVAGWASVQHGVEGPPVWDVVARYLRRHKVVAAQAGSVRLLQGGH